MIVHRRISCKECKREWVNPKYFVNSSPLTITGNKRDDLCPICGSGSIVEVEYYPSFLGGDIQRSDLPAIEGLNTGDEVNEVPSVASAPGFIQGRVITGEE